MKSKIGCPNVTKAEAKREVCGMVAAQISAGATDFVEQSGRDFTDADYERLLSALDDLRQELFRRARAAD